MGISLALLCALAGQAPAAVADSGMNLAASYPNAAVFRQMARRGAADFAARHGRLPHSLEEVRDAGYTAYLFPTNWQPSLVERNGELRISWVGLPAFLAGQSLRSFDIVVSLPPAGLYTDRQRRSPLDPGGSSGEQVLERHWHFSGAKWLSAGFSWEETEQILRRERLFVHLNWMTSEFCGVNAAPPSSLADLEDLLGTERNHLAWQSVQQVAHLTDVGQQAGNFFVGWDLNSWTISMNLGPETSTLRWKPNGRGAYSPGVSLAY